MLTGTAVFLIQTFGGITLAGLLTVVLIDMRKLPGITSTRSWGNAFVIYFYGMAYIWFVQPLLPPSAFILELNTEGESQLLSILRVQDSSDGVVCRPIALAKKGIGGFRAYLATGGLTAFYKGIPNYQSPAPEQWRDMQIEDLITKRDAEGWQKKWLLAAAERKYASIIHSCRSEIIEAEDICRNPNSSRKRKPIAVSTLLCANLNLLAEQCPRLDRYLNSAPWDYDRNETHK